MNKRVLHLLNEIKFSGAETMLKIAAPYFIKNGVELHALSTGSVKGDYATELENAGFQIHHLSFKKSPGYFFNLFKLLRRYRFDIVHIHPERAFFEHALIARFAGIKQIVRTIHNVFQFKSFLRIRKIIERSLARRLLNLKFVSIGASVNEIEFNNFRNLTTIIPNWIDPLKFIPASMEEKHKLRRELGIDDSVFVLTSVGSCQSMKNHLHILDAVHKIIHQDRTLLYLHAGEGPLLDSEKHHADKLALGKYVRFLGQISNIRDILIVSDIFVMPSDYEGLPISCIEAMSCEIPIVAYNVYGLKDVVINDFNGILTETNADALASALKKLMNNHELRFLLGKNARKFVLENFQVKDSVEILSRLYAIN
jgi:glycosyltransferase involved in cell wall biosynthesis